MGRCVVTHHSNFIIFNVYIPNQGDAKKLRFLELLSKSMASARAQYNLPIMLAGDFNIALARIDNHPLRVRIKLQEIAGQPILSNDICHLLIVNFPRLRL